MVGEIKWAFEENLKYVTWMDAETKRAAKEKVGERNKHTKTHPALPPSVETHLSHLFGRLAGRRTPYTTWWATPTSS